MVIFSGKESIYNEAISVRQTETTIKLNPSEFMFYKNKKWVKVPATKPDHVFNPQNING